MRDRALSTQVAEQPQTAAGPAFPAPVYRDTVLAHIFEDGKRFFLRPLLAIERAHTVMLARQGIMPAHEAAACLAAVDALDLPAIEGTRYDGRFEDLFFFIEKQLADACGAEVAGKMHTARSRNDIDLTMYRMVLRQLLLGIHRASVGLRATLLALASAHRDALMPAYTHNQPAQPTTLGHYLMAYIEVLERDAERLRAAFARVNRNPLGACAITTTGFPIDRGLTGRLLGFDGLQVNSYGAIAAVDYLVESCSVLAVTMLSLGRFTQDLLLWSTAEFGYLRLSDAYVQISSIMPQKRNPVPLEHVRILASRAMTEAQGVLGSLHNTPFADMNDAEDDLQPLVYTAFENAERSLRLLAGALGEATFNLERMAVAAEANFLPVTELADTLVRRTGMSFHAAHDIVSRAVKELTAAGIGFDAEAMVRFVEREAPRAAGAVRPIATEDIRLALSARHFVKVRSIPGGPAAAALGPEINRAEEQVVFDVEWNSTAEQRIAAAGELLRQACDDLMGQGHAAR